MHLGPIFPRNLLAGTPARAQLILDGRGSDTRTQVVMGYATTIINNFNRDWAVEHSVPVLPAPVIERAWF